MVDRELYDSYSSALAANANLVQAAVLDIKKRIGDLKRKEISEVIKLGYTAIVDMYGSFAAAAAVEFYQTQRSMHADLPAYEAQMITPQYGGLLRYDVNQAIKGADIEKAMESLSQTSIQRVMEYADETLLGNARADPAHPRWAIVPHAGACGWCRMLGSNGFMYSRKETADRSRHPSCRCTPVVDFDTAHPSLNGYEPDALYGRYKRARKQVEEGARRDWASMPQAERDRYKRKGRSAYDVFLRNRIASAM